MSKTTNIYKEFFTEGKGLTSTSANYLANLAKQAYTEDEAFLDSCSFLNVDMEIIGDEKKTCLEIGMNEDDLKSIHNRIKRIGMLKGFCAWMREAVKAKEKWVASVAKNTSLNDWASENNITLPEIPISESLVQAENQMSIADKAEFYVNEAITVAYGTFIHPGNPGHKAYKKLVDALHNPRTCSENGRDTIIRTYSASVPADVVNAEMDVLRDRWRYYEAKVNKTKHDLQEANNTANNDAERAYIIARDKYNKEYENLNRQYMLWVKEETERISNLKIIIPKALQPIYDELRQLGKDNAK